MEGIILTIFPTRGYGFIRGKEDGRTRFFHASVVQPPGQFEQLLENDSVEFEDVDTGVKGLRATWVRRTKNAA
jgi:cold shock CspA family protein